METSKLIILRGPSGSGKSTAAQKLFESTERRTVIVNQDQYRFMFKPPGLDEAGKEMITANVLTALQHNYDVILEGILNSKSYRTFFERIIQAHPKENHAFYFDVSFDETLRRHANRQKVNLFTEDDMKEWYKPQDLLGYVFEQIIPETFSAEQTIDMIRKFTGT